MLVSRLGDFAGLRVADLYAGSGALGLEALSRGAVHATFVENDPAALKAIRVNLARLGVTAVADVRPGSAATLPPSPPFDLILADPPYAPGSGSAVVTAVAEAEWLAPGGWLAIESPRGAAIAAGPYELDAERDIGRARLTLLRRPA